MNKNDIFSFLLIFGFFILIQNGVAGQSCSFKDFKKVGCSRIFGDRELQFSDRDGAKKPSGVPIDWNDFSNYLNNLVCRCYNSAKQGGYSFFATGYYGECFATSDKKLFDFNSATSKHCINGENRQCVVDSQKMCTGQEEREFVYSLVKDEEAGQLCSFNDFKKVGCFKKTPQISQDLLFSDRVGAQNPSGVSIDWGDYNNYLNSMAMRCYNNAQQGGYSFFAIGYYGECFAGKDEKQFDTHTKVMDCMNGEFNACVLDSQKICTGQADNEFVYSLDKDEEAGQSCCFNDFKKVGCFDITRPARQTMLFSDRGVGSINWGDFNNWIIRMACRCYNKAKQGGFSFFTIGFYGECFATSDKKLFDIHTPTSRKLSKDCVNGDFRTCVLDTREICIGKDNSGFVYSLV